MPTTVQLTAAVARDARWTWFHKRRKQLYRIGHELSNGSIKYQKWKDLSNQAKSEIL